MHEVRLGFTALSVNPNLVGESTVWIKNSICTVIDYECPYVMKPQDDKKRKPANISFSQYFSPYLLVQCDSVSVVYAQFCALEAPWFQKNEESFPVTVSRVTSVCFSGLCFQYPQPQFRVSAPHFLLQMSLMIVGFITLYSLSQNSPQSVPFVLPCAYFPLGLEPQWKWRWGVEGVRGPGVPSAHSCRTSAGSQLQPPALWTAVWLSSDQFIFGVGSCPDRKSVHPVGHGCCGRENFVFRQVVTQ